MQCRVRICSECTTKVEGINYCVSCLAGLAVEGGRRATRSQADSGTATPYLEAAGWAAVLALGLWLTLEVLLPGAG